MIEIAAVQILLNLRSIGRGGSDNFDRFVAVHVEDAPIAVAHFNQSELLRGIGEILHKLNRFLIVFRSVTNIHDFVVRRAYASQFVIVIVGALIRDDPALCGRIVVRPLLKLQRVRVLASRYLEYFTRSTVDEFVSRSIRDSIPYAIPRIKLRAFIDEREVSIDRLFAQ